MVARQREFLDYFLSFLVSLLGGKCTEVLGFYSLLLSGGFIKISDGSSFLDSSCRPHPSVPGAAQS